MRKFQERGIQDPQPISPRLALPFLRAAADETDPELQERWANLMANAVDPDTSSLRQVYTDTLAQFEPLDARLLEEICAGLSSISLVVQKLNRREVRFNINKMAEKLSVSADEVEISVQHLHKLGCGQFGYETEHGEAILDFTPTPLSRALHSMIQP